MRPNEGEESEYKEKNRKIVTPFQAEKERKHFRNPQSNRIPEKDGEKTGDTWQEVRGNAALAAQFPQ